MLRGPVIMVLYPFAEDTETQDYDHTQRSQEVDITWGNFSGSRK